MRDGGGATAIRAWLNGVALGGCGSAASCAQPLVLPLKQDQADGTDVLVLAVNSTAPGRLRRVFVVMKSDDIPSESSEAEHTALIYEAPEFVEQVREHLPRGWRLIELTNDTTKLALSTVEAAIGDVPAALLDSMPSLKLHQGVGFVTPIEFKQCHGGLAFNVSERYPNLQICRGGSFIADYARTIAEWCIAASLELVFQLGSVTTQMKECAWSESAPSCPRHSTFGTRPALMNMTLGIVGYGHVGKQVAQLGSALFGSVVGSSPGVSGPAPAPLSWWSTNNDDVLRSSDLIVLSFFDHGPDTVGLINSTAFSLMKRGARVVMFVGSLGVDEEAAFKSVQSGHLAGLAINQWWER